GASRHATSPARPETTRRSEAGSGTEATTGNRRSVKVLKVKGRSGISVDRPKSAAPAGATPAPPDQSMVVGRWATLAKAVDDGGGSFSVKGAEPVPAMPVSKSRPVIPRVPALTKLPPVPAPSSK